MISEADEATRREVLDDEYVDARNARTTDLTRDFQDFITRRVAEIWNHRAGRALGERLA